ncbi:MAG: glycosyltransferase family 4 protein [Solirubrobacteraceae bacterium]
MILFVHHRYRSLGGEEAAVDGLLALVRERLGEDAELLTRDSSEIGRGRAAAGLLGGGLAPDEVTRAVRRTRARIVHAHNLHPTFGWRALAAARSAGAATVLHLHQYRLVCAIGTCFRDGRDCLSCHGANTLPGVIHNCRGSHSEAVTYGASLALWSRRLAGLVDAFVVPSRFAAQRLRELGAPVGDPIVVPHMVDTPGVHVQRPSDGYALLAARLVPEKGIEVAIKACEIAGVGLVVAGEGPERTRVEADVKRDGPAVRFVGRVAPAELAQLRERAAVALAPSLSAESFGLAAAEAMAAGLPVAGSRIGALPELLPDEWLAPPGDARALADVITRVIVDPDAGARALARVREISAPESVAPALTHAYERAVASRQI